MEGEVRGGGHRAWTRHLNGGGLSTWVVAWAPPATVRQSFAPRMRRCHTLIMDRGSLLPPPHFSQSSCPSRYSANPCRSRSPRSSLFAVPPLSILFNSASTMSRFLMIMMGFHPSPLLQSSSSSPLFYCLIHLIVSVIPVAPLSCILPTERTVRLLTSSCEVQHRTRYPSMLLTIMSIECEALPISWKLGRLDCKRK